MAIAAECVWEIRTTGTSTGGGGYVSGGTDYSQQDSPQLSVTDAVTNGTTTVTSATGGFTSAMVGNIIYIAGGTAPLTATRYQITAFTNTNTITIDAAPAASTGCTLNVGGAINAPWNLAQAVNGNTIYIKSGTYTTGTQWSLQSGLGVTATAKNMTRYIGYDNISNRALGKWTETNRPVLTFTANSNFILGNNNNLHWISIRFRNTNGTKSSATCFQNTGTASKQRFYNCVFGGVSGEGFYNVLSQSTSAGGQFNPDCFGCEFSYNVSGAAWLNSSSGATIWLNNICYSQEKFIATSSTATLNIQGCVISTTNRCIDLLNTGGMNTLTLRNSTLYTTSTTEPCLYSGNSITASDLNRWDIQNNIFYGGEYGIESTRANHGNNGINDMRGNAFGGQAVAAVLNVTSGSVPITLTADPFVDKANFDMSLNNTAGGGALLRGALHGNTLPGSSVSGYADVGGLQHVDSGGSGGGSGSYLFGA